jgi:predicted acylesterase/phospholipase RssA
MNVVETAARILLVFRWIFLYLPRRFSVPLVGLVCWMVGYVWPWQVEVLFPTLDSGQSWRSELREWLARSLVPNWIVSLNLAPAAKASVVLLLLATDVVLAYNLAVWLHRALRRRSRGVTALLALVGTTFIYSYPWLLAPGTWGRDRATFAPYVIREGFLVGSAEYGLLWWLPLTALAALGITEAAGTWGRERTVALEAGAFDARVDNEHFSAYLQRPDDAPPPRIGIILGGGGAKGVYQAGALRAIYEFLQQHNALQHVRMVAGTSIGAWNGTFWLANAILPPRPGEPSPHEAWWRTAALGRIADFDTYVPFTKNSFLTTRPWRETFDELFGTRGTSGPARPSSASGPSGAPALAALARAGAPLRFYFTRSNVSQGRLEFSTNWGDVERANAFKTAEVDQNGFRVVDSVNDIREAVFASMDLPPLFPFQRLDNHLYEDGGVIDNLPIMFGTLVEECDLLFVLPLNGTYEGVPHHRSILGRLMRVINVRQGVIERNSFRLAYLYNQLRYRMEQIHDYERQLGQKAAAAADDTPEARPTAKARKPVRIFAICPAPPLAVDTAEFWKTSAFAGAFDLMYNATREELRTFNFETIPLALNPDRSDWIRMALVSPQGGISHTDRF